MPVEHESNSSLENKEKCVFSAKQSCNVVFDPRELLKWHLKDAALARMNILDLKSWIFSVRDFLVVI